MADYRRGLMDMTPEERQKVAPGFVPKTDVSKPLSVKGAEVAIEATPVGTAFAVNDIYEELKKEQPDYVKIGLMAAGEAVGLIPAVGDVAQSMLRKGTDSVVDVASNIPKVPRTNEDIAQAENLLDDPAAMKNWQETKKEELGGTQRQANPEASKQAAQELFEGQATSQETRRRIEESIPAPQEYNAEQVMTMMPTVTEVTGSLGKKAGKYGILGVKGFDLEAGQKVSSRLDIPAYNNYDTWVVSIHDGTKDAGSVVGFGQAIRLKNINFGSKSKEALDIARGQRTTATGEDKPMGKSTIARIFGEYQPEDPYELQKKAADIIASDSDEWIQVGMNPYRGSAFYNKATGKPVFEADEVIQVGPLVLAKNVKEPTISQLKELGVKTRDGKIRLFNEGGMAMDEQTEAVFKSSRTGYAEGGSPKPRNRWEMFKQWLATEKKEDEDEASAFDRFLDSFMGDPIERGKRKKEQGAYNYALGGEVGEAPDTTVGVDPESGNEVPLGAMPEEVRDDIPAQLSEGEYVVPADVVRFYGVKFFEDLRTQAKTGYQEMEKNGRIGGEPVGPEGMEMVEPEDDLPFDISELQTVDDDMPVGYDEGGLEVGTPLFNEGIEDLFGGPITSGLREQRTYVGPNGETAILTFVNGKPDAAAQSLIDLGYKPEGEASTAPATSAPTVEAPTSKPIVDKPSSNKDDYNEANLRAFEKEQEQVEKSASRFEGKSAKELIDYGNKLVDGSLGKAAKGVSALNPMLGTIAGVARRAEIFNVSKGLKEKYQEAMTAGNTQAAEEIDKAFQNITSRGRESGSGVLGGGGLLGGGGVLRDVDGNGEVNFGDTWLGDLLGFDAGGAGIQGPKQGDSFNGARRVGGTGKLSYKSLKDFYADTSLKSHALGTQPKSKAAAAKSNSQPSASQAIQSWQNATAAVKANSGNTTSPAYHAAIKAQSDASRAATAAIRAERSGSSGSGSSSVSSGQQASNSYQAQESDDYGMLNKGGLMAKKNKK
jgi:hypothetical protein